MRKFPSIAFLVASLLSTSVSAEESVDVGPLEQAEEITEVVHEDHQSDLELSVGSAFLNRDPAVGIGAKLDLLGPVDFRGGLYSGQNHISYREDFTILRQTVAELNGTDRYLVTTEFILTPVETGLQRGRLSVSGSAIVTAYDITLTEFEDTAGQTFDGPPVLNILFGGMSRGAYRYDVTNGFFLGSELALGYLFSYKTPFKHSDGNYALVEMNFVFGFGL